MSSSSTTVNHPLVMGGLTGHADSPLLVSLPGHDREWAETIELNRQPILDALSTAGAILFRGGVFNEFRKVEQFARLVFDELIAYNAEHRKISSDSNVQRPVEYSSTDFLLWHNENTFNSQFPSKAIFACEQPAMTGGQTPIVDSRSVFRALDRTVRKEFEEKGVMYVRTYRRRDFIGLGWETIFQTTDKNVVERECRDKQISCEWLANDMLRTRVVQPAIYSRHKAGEACWVNQAQHWHVSCLSSGLKAGFEACIERVEDYPRNCFFGDGSIIPDSYLSHILRVYEDHQFSFDWVEGDLLLVDNVLKAHARNAYEGERKIMVCFGDPIGF